MLDDLRGAPMEALLTAIRRKGHPVRRTRVVQVGAVAGWKIAHEAGLGNGVGSGPLRELYARSRW